MSEAKYELPGTNKSAFNYPHCSAYARQQWFLGAITSRGREHLGFVSEEEVNSLIKSEAQMLIKYRTLTQDGWRKWKENMDARNPVKARFSTRIVSPESINNLYNVWFSQCDRCDNFAIWRHDRMVWPQTGDAPPPNSDLPDDMRADYEEASAILGSSPRGAAALLRIVVQKLCKHLGGKGDNLNEDIASLVKNGLDADIRKALDTIRVIGNNAVHPPGRIDFQDDGKTARSLFDLVNLIVDSTISQKRKISEMYDNLPDGSRKSIEKRDKSKNF